MKVEQIRSLFPVTLKSIYLNNASQSPLNIVVYEKLQELLKAELDPVGRKAFDRNTTKALLSKLLGGLPEDYALQTSTGVGLGIVAQGIDFKEGDNVVLPEKEHWNNTFPWLELEKKGVEVRFVELDLNHRITPEAFEKLVDSRTRVVAVAAVRYNSGFRPNLVAIGQIAHQNGALFVVDVAQAAGLIPMNVERDQIDVMSGCGFKWLLGMHGTGFLYVNKKVNHLINPVLPGMFAAEHLHDKLIYHNDSRKFETGTIAYSLFNAWNAGLELLLTIGVDNIYEYNLSLTGILIDGLHKKGYQLITPTKNIAERTSIVHFNTGSTELTKELYNKLIDNQIFVTLQGENIRVSPNFFNTEEEINKFLEMV